MDPKKMKYPVPICATVSRTTGEIKFQWEDNEDDFRKMGEIMLKIGTLMEHAREGSAAVS